MKKNPKAKWAQQFGMTIAMFLEWSLAPSSCCNPVRYDL